MSWRRWWKERARRKALRQYATIVRRRLFELYGPSKTYSPGRVKRAVEESGANSDNIMLAYAMYCTPDHFGDVAASAGFDPADVPSLTALRQELADVSDGGVTFGPADGYDGGGSFSHDVGGGDSTGSDGGDGGGGDGTF